MRRSGGTVTRISVNTVQSPNVCDACAAWESIPKPARGAHLPFLDALRGVAILSVYLLHSLGASFGFGQPPWSGLFPNFLSPKIPQSYYLIFPVFYGWAGVAVFFAISGFCIHLSHTRASNKSWVIFFRRRFFRIYPPFLIALLAFYLLPPWGSFGHQTFPRLEQLAANVLAINNLFERTFFSQINPSFWSVAVEIQLYVLYPALLWVASRFSWRAAITLSAACEFGIAAAASVSEFAGLKVSFALLHSPFAYWFSWAIGAYAAHCFLESRRSFLSDLRFEVLLPVALFLPLFKPAKPFAFAAFAVLSAVAIERFWTGKWATPMKGKLGLFWRHLSFLGLVSYSFYLIHQPIIDRFVWVQVKGRMGDLYSPLLGFAFCIVLYLPILLLSWLGLRFVERPSIAAGRRWGLGMH